MRARAARLCTHQDGTLTGPGQGALRNAELTRTS